MAEIDPVILELRADLGRYKAELKSTTALAQTSFDRQSRAAENLERQIRASSGQIAGTLRGLSGVFAGAFSARELSGIIDSFTRFQNQLRVAGLEGENLSRVQDRLLEVAQRNGVQLEAVGTLYSRAAQNQRELGASTSDLINLTSAVAASLRISGTSTQEASGALLQLGQALGSPRVQAEEFNSLLDTMQPLLREAAKRIDGTGGSLSGLTRLIKDQNGAGVSNVQLFQAITASLSDLEKTASGAGLTIEAAFTKLTNQLTVYIGQSAQANGATSAIAAGLELLANNLDTVADALAVIAALALGRFAAGMAAAAVSSGLASTAIFAIQARAIGAATTMEALALVSGTAGRALLAAFGGPVGLAVTALALGIGYLATQTSAAARAARINSEAQKIAGDATRRAAEAVDRLSTAHGKARDEALKAAKAEYENTKQKLASAQASALLAAVELRRVQATESTSPRSMMGTGYAGGVGFTPGGVGAGAINAADEKYRAREAAVVSLMGDVEKLRKALAAPEAGPSSISSAKKDKKRKGRTGPSDTEIEARFQNDLFGIRKDQIQAELAIATSAEQRADLQGELVEIDYQQRRAEIQNEKNYTAAQKKRLIAALNELNGRDDNGNIVTNSPFGKAINREFDANVRQLQERALSDQRDSLAAEAELIDSRRERLEIEKRILALAQEEERSRLEGSIASGEIADAAVARANLERRQRAERSGLGRRYESPISTYRRDIYSDINDQIENIEVQGLRDLTDELAKSAEAALGLKGALGNIVGELIRIGIERQVIGPIADALFGKQGGGGGGSSGLFGSLISAGASIFGRASGGYVGAGQLVRVNEASSPGNPEYFRPQGAGHIIPVGQTRATQPRAGATIVQHITVDGRNSVTPAGFAQQILSIADQRARQTAAAMGQGVLKAVPGRLSGYQNDGT